MTSCAVTTGFFVLGRCGNPAATACGGCGRPVCAEHAGPGLCPECTSAQGYVANPYDPAWTRGYRRWYYQRSAHDYSDAYWYSRFDTYDRGGFDQGDQFTGDYNQDDGFEFGDS